MATITQRTPDRRRPQIFHKYDYAAIEAALAEKDKPALWLKHIMHDLAHAIQKIAEPRPPRG
jgi:hypothetical protein